MSSILYFMGMKDTDPSNYRGIGLGFGFIGLLIGFLYCYGAARLSYSYNLYTQNTSYALLWAFLCFIFPYMYYPYYAIMLNPVGLMATSGQMVGGSRRR